MGSVYAERHGPLSSVKITQVLGHDTESLVCLILDTGDSPNGPNFSFNVRNISSGDQRSVLRVTNVTGFWPATAFLIESWLLTLLPGERR